MPCYGGHLSFHGAPVLYLVLLACPAEGTSSTATPATGSSSSTSSSTTATTGTSTTTGSGSTIPDCTVDPEPVPGPDCLTGPLACGDVVTSTTAGGTEVLDADLYESAACFVPFTDLDGPERVWEIEVAEGQRATFTLDAPCADLALAVIRWDDLESCPRGRKHNIGECEGAPPAAASAASVWADRPIRYLVAVDAPAGVEAPFTLSVSCEGR